MTEWVLLIGFHVGYGDTGVVPAAHFPTQSACEIAMNTLAKARGFDRNWYACVNQATGETVIKYS